MQTFRFFFFVRSTTPPPHPHHHHLKFELISHICNTKCCRGGASSILHYYSVLSVTKIRVAHNKESWGFPFGNTLARTDWILPTRLRRWAGGIVFFVPYLPAAEDKVWAFAPLQSSSSAPSESLTVNRSPHTPLAVVHNTNPNSRGLWGCRGEGRDVLLLADIHSCVYRCDGCKDDLNHNPFLTAFSGSRSII